MLQRLSTLRGRPWEVGGWLLGYRDGQALVITHATPPNSRGTPAGVNISGVGHGPAFDALWEATGGHVTYLGDWHSHPAGSDLPSARDQEAVIQIAEDPDFKTPQPLIAIVTTGRLPRRSRRGPRFYLGSRSGELHELTPRPFPAVPAEVEGPEPWIRGWFAGGYSWMRCAGHTRPPARARHLRELLGQRSGETGACSIPSTP